jgi:hypothetical protein
MINNLDKENLSYFAAIANRIWMARNMQVYENSDIPKEMTIHQADLSITNFKKATNQIWNLHQNHSNARLLNNHGTKRQHNRDQRGVNGKKPHSGTIKMNTDASLHEDGTWGMGAIARLMMTVRSLHRRHGNLMGGGSGSL